jgi:hypothetical protein
VEKYWISTACGGLQHKARYFMTDIYPANAERFTAAFEQIDATAKRGEEDWANALP